MPERVMLVDKKNIDAFKPFPVIEELLNDWERDCFYSTLTDEISGAGELIGVEYPNGGWALAIISNECLAVAMPPRMRMSANQVVYDIFSHAYRNGWQLPKLGGSNAE